jgi:protocatechuate 3,4-dioxygenase beta subunit
MPWMRGLFFSILFSAVCLSQQVKTDSNSQKTASISGTVLQASTRAPLKNVEVALVHSPDASENEDESSTAPESTAKTDDKGHFEFSKLAPGPYFVRASRAGMVLKSHQWQEGVLVNLEAGKSQTLDLLMLPTAIITGQVLNEEGEPMQHVSVMAMRYTYTTTGRQLAQAATASSDDEGRFRLFGLQPGSYLVTANPTEGAFDGGAMAADGGGMMALADTPNSAAPSKKNQTVYTTTYYPNERSPENATPIVVKAGDSGQANFTLARVRAFSVSGTVAGMPAAKSEDDNQSLQNIRMVMAVREGSSMPAGMTVAAKDSTFRFRSLTAGRYKLVAMGMGAGGGANSAGSADIVVESSDVTGVVIGAQSSLREITGQVRAEGNSKPDFSKLYIVVAPEADPERGVDFSSMAGFFGGINGFAQVKNDGSFKVNLSPSAKPYNVALTAHESGLEDWYTRKVLFGGKDVLESGFKPAEGQAGPLEILISNKGSGIEGTVLDKDEKPFPGADVVAFPADPKLRRHSDLVQSATADQQGHFRMRGLRPGEYIVFALEDSREQPFTTELFQKTNSGKIQTVKLEAAPKQQVQLEVIRQGQ